MDLLFRHPFMSHQRYEVVDDMSVAKSAIGCQRAFETNISTQQYLVNKPVLYQLLYYVNAGGIAMPIYQSSRIRSGVQ